MGNSSDPRIGSLLCGQWRSFLVPDTPIYEYSRVGSISVGLVWFSRKVIYWSTKSTLTKEIYLDAILIAIWNRKPTHIIIIYYDQGYQFSSDEWWPFCQQRHLQASMSRESTRYDIAVTESFFSGLKRERICNQVHHERDKDGAKIFDYIEFIYNRIKRYSHTERTSPEAFE